MTAKRKPASGPAAGLFDSALAASVREHAQQIWLAGMGAFAKAQDEGRQVFESLVSEGSTLQAKTQRVAADKLQEVTGKVSSLADDVGARAGQQWDKLESIFEDRTAKALRRLGVPTSADLKALADRIDALSAQLAADRSSRTPKATGQASKGSPPVRKTPARKRTPRKTA